MTLKMPLEFNPFYDVKKSACVLSSTNIFIVPLIGHLIHFWPLREIVHSDQDVAVTVIRDGKRP